MILAVTRPMEWVTNTNCIIHHKHKKAAMIVAFFIFSHSAAYAVTENLKYSNADRALHPLSKQLN